MTVPQAAARRVPLAVAACANDPLKIICDLLLEWFENYFYDFRLLPQQNRILQHISKIWSKNKNIKMSPFKSSEKTEGGPDRSALNNKFSSVTLMKTRV